MLGSCSGSVLGSCSGSVLGSGVLGSCNDSTEPCPLHCRVATPSHGYPGIQDASDTKIIMLMCMYPSLNWIFLKDDYYLKVLCKLVWDSEALL